MVFTKINGNKLVVLSLLVGSIFFTSCGSKKDIIYLQDVSNYETIVNKDNFTPKFKIDDIVDIHVSTLDPTASIPYNLYRGAGQGGGIRPEQVNYLVDANGEIDFPVVGKVKIAGLSPQETRVLLRDKLSIYLKDPIINIRLQNFTVTVLGEVNRPGTYPINGERVSIFKALGFAGDLTIKGKRKNVLVIRDFDGTKVYTKIDLTSKDVLNSPVYYLTQNDVVIVEPNKSAIASASLDTRTTVGISIASLLITSAIILITRN